MSGMIELQDGFCVSCGRESGVVRRSCPFCGETVWHPRWRQSLFWYIVLVLPLGISGWLAVESAAAISVAESLLSASWPHQMSVAVCAGILLLPYENRRLVHPSSGSRRRWLLNALAASCILLLCALLFAVSLRCSAHKPVWRLLACVPALSGAAVPLVMNCSWWRLATAILFATALAVL